MTWPRAFLPWALARAYKPSSRCSAGADQGRGARRGREEASRAGEKVCGADAKELLKERLSSCASEDSIASIRMRGSSSSARRRVCWSWTSRARCTFCWTASLWTPIRAPALWMPSRAVIARPKRCCLRRLRARVSRNAFASPSALSARPATYALKSRSRACSASTIPMELSALPGLWQHH